MKQPALPLGVVAILAVAMSAAAGAGVILSGQRIEFALALAAIVLATAHLAIFLYRDWQHRRRFAGLSDLHLRSRKLAEELAALTERIDAIEGRSNEPAAPPSPPAADDLNREFEELRLSVKKLAEEYDRAVADRDERAAPAANRRAESQPNPADHRLEFFLEPIVSLADDVTQHYRASLVLEGPGQRVAFEELARQAAANGLRPDLDGHAVSRVLTVSQKLAAKRPGTCVFVPVGAETLASQEALAAIEWQMERAGKAAATIVFEIDHAAMAALSPRGIEGLARLARNGAGMALSRAHGMGIDLAALRALQFRFITFSAAALPAERHGVPAWASTARLAGQYGFKVGVQGLFYEGQIDVAGRWAELGSGPAFAPPRRVKGEAVSIDQIRTAA
ncbi:EAL domain-containing protein [Nordella sp. HKS 07]|uniref:EAL domain-containing protein n=1 Tax=Nordella sp. HKS 07 TaxID=2712222 RepID=UPI0013E1B468|nr:EAL domain-containing protein [Nordella sp. HKS 07]QIG49137.1 EAL domain-containing protein [Nordella sp. HKS 07]